MMFFIAFLTLSFGSIEQQAVVKSIDADDLKELNVDSTILLDVRTPEEFENGRIKGAILMDYKEDNFRQMATRLDN